MNMSATFQELWNQSQQKTLRNNTADQIRCAKFMLYVLRHHQTFGMLNNTLFKAVMLLHWY